MTATPQTFEIGLDVLRLPKSGKAYDLCSGWWPGMPLAEGHPQFQVLTYRSPRGERNVLIRKVYLNRFMEEMKEYLDQEFEGSGVRLVLDLRYRGAARFDESKLRRVFHNIARNAREAMPGGGTFSISVYTEGSELVFTFDDTGTGIPPELADRMFEPFATAGKVGGTGLGLAMVKQIAEEHRGTVAYQSQAKKGTRFIFRIPLEA